MVHPRARTPDSPTTGARRRLLTRRALIGGWVWVGLLLVAPVLSEPLLIPLLLGNGFAAAFYLAVLYWVRGGLYDGAAAFGLATVSGTHMIWLGALSGWLQSFGLLATLPDEPLILLATGLAYAAALGAASRSIVPAVAMAAAGMGAGAVALIPGLGELAGLTTGCAILHAVMVTVVASETRRRFPPLDPTRCVACGYSLVGIPAGLHCPECGMPFGASDA
ncbi:MAG: hypothetical protein IPJ41_13265 [Phycisphaerales bacterium]|nr:hypothetical protein [Phycisphaerales bacterium]